MKKKLTIKELFFGKSQKTSEQVGKELDQLKEQREELTAQMSMAQASLKAIHSALQVVEGDLVLNPQNKHALKQKEQFNKKSEQLEKEVRDVEQKLQRINADIEVLASESSRQAKEQIVADYFEHHRPLLFRVVLTKKVNKLVNGTKHFDLNYFSYHLMRNLGFSEVDINQNTKPEVREWHTEIDKLYRKYLEELSVEADLMLQPISDVLYGK